VILSRHAKRLRESTGRPVYAASDLGGQGIGEKLKISFVRPTKMLLTEPVVGFFTLWVSFAWGILFLFFNSVAQTFAANYAFDTFQTGACPWYWSSRERPFVREARLRELHRNIRTSMTMTEAMRAKGIPIVQSKKRQAFESVG